MSARSVFALFLLTLLGAVSTADAALTASWRANAITATAISNDPMLAIMQSWSLVATNTTGYFQAVGLRAVLPQGQYFYRHPLGGSVRPTQAAINANPALAFHTYMTSQQQVSGQSIGGPAIFGGFPETEPLSFGGPFDAIPGTFSASWGHPKAIVWNIPPGSYEVMRATFPLGVLPTIHPQSIIVYIQESTSVPTTIPEPGALGLLVSGLILMRRRSG